MSEAEPEQDASLLLTVFSLGDALFALDALRVQEIIRVGPITRIHHAGAHILGIINLRGHIVTILDPAKRMGLAAQDRGPENRILILDWKDESVGLLVSSIHDMLRAEPASLAPPPSNLKKTLGAFLAAVVQFQGHMASVLDIQALVAVEGAE